MKLDTFNLILLGFAIGMIFGSLLVSANRTCGQEVDKYVALKNSGVLISISVNSHYYLWDEKTKTSIYISSSKLEEMYNGLNDMKK